MKIYWSLKDIPELAEIPKEEAKKIWRRCYWKVFRNWQTWFALVVCGGCVALGIDLGHFCSEFVGSSAVVAIVAVIGGGIGGFFFGQVATTMTRPYIREYLNSHNEVSRA